MKALVAALLLAAPAGAAAPFRPLDLKAAKAAAAAEKKPLLVYVVSNNCPPCERMHLATFKDPAVLGVLAAKAVAIEFNSDLLPALGAELRVTKFPTTIFFAPNGKELDRIFGFHEAKPFIAAFEDALAGRTSLDRARNAVSAAKDGHAKVNARHELANALAGAGRSQEALAEFLWLYDEGAKADPKFAEQRMVLLPVEIAALGRSYPPALEPLRERRAAVVARLKTPQATKKDAADLRCLNRALAESDMHVASQPPPP